MARQSRRDNTPARDVHMEDHARFYCDYCGQEIVIPVDVSAGAVQQYMEECSVCCRPNVIHVRVDRRGIVRVESGRDQD